MKFLALAALLACSPALADSAKAVEAFRAGNLAEAERQARAAVAKGEGRGYVILAHLLRALDRGGKLGEGESYVLLLEGARRGFPPAQYFVAKEHEVLFMGYEREEDRLAALRWFGEAAKAPDSLDMEEISVTGQRLHCDVGWRIEAMLKSPADALPWYQRCADAGCGEGMDKLAALHPDPAARERWREAGKSAKPSACLNG
jgi:hypothetical protein